MALSVVSRPTGYRVLDGGAFTKKTGAFTNGSTTITTAAHGLNTGDYIYVNDSQALGFWYVTTGTVNTFSISEYSGATTYTFINAGSLHWYSTAAIVWHAVHLPIVYKLQSTLWPTNSVDTFRTVTSYANDNGYVKLTLSGTLTSTVTELEFVKIVFVGGTSAIYQILTWYSNSVVTINLAYIGGITFTSVQYYYNNYHAKIRVYAGLNTAHPLTAQKPYTLITEQKCVPDSSGIITLNVNEFLKQQISILENDLLKGTLPNNLDSYCQFYIDYAEAYDYSVGGYTLLDYIGPYISDAIGNSFDPYAINSDLPFKNIYSGAMCDYAHGSVSPTFTSPTAHIVKFLTPTLYPEINVGQYFDLSFIVPSINWVSGFVYVQRDLYTNGNLAESLKDHTFLSVGQGVYRYPIEVSFHNEDRIDITVKYEDYPFGANNAALTETKTITVGGCSFNYIDISWLNYLGGFDYWRFKSNSDYGVQIENTTQVRKNIFTNWPKSYGAGADTIRQETSRDSSQTITVRAEYITMDQINDLYRIKTSPLVQIVNSRTDRRTILVDSDSFVYLQQSEKLFSLEFNCVLTDNLPSQSL